VIERRDGSRTPATLVSTTSYYCVGSGVRRDNPSPPYLPQHSCRLSLQNSSMILALLESSDFLIISKDFPNIQGKWEHVQGSLLWGLFSL